MTNSELKSYAISGLLVRIKAEQDKLTKITDSNRQEQIKQKIKKMENHYTELLCEMQGKTPIE